MALIETPESLHERVYKKKLPDDSEGKCSGRLKALMMLIQKHDPAILFDIGCGMGSLGRKIKEWKSEVILHGCDISTLALKRAKLHFDKLWKANLDCEDIPVESALYDVVVCSEVLEHIYDVNHGIREVNRLLKPDGVGLLTVPNLAYWRFRLDILKGCLPLSVGEDQHIHQFNQESFEKKVQKSGMAILSISGHSVRLPWFANWKPSVFSQNLIFEVKRAAGFTGFSSGVKEVLSDADIVS